MDVGFEKGYKRVRIYKADGAEKDEFVKKTRLLKYSGRDIFFDREIYGGLA